MRVYVCVCVLAMFLATSTAKWVTCSRPHEPELRVPEVPPTLSWLMQTNSSDDVGLYAMAFVIGSTIGVAFIYYIVGVITYPPVFDVPAIPVFQQEEQVPPADTDEECYIHRQDISQFPEDWSGRAAAIFGLPEPWNPTQEINFGMSSDSYATTSRPRTKGTSESNWLRER